MPSQLYLNDAVSFICARNFTYAGVDYEIGTDFPQDAAGKNLETLVRSRRVIPVVDDMSDKPRHWYREIKQRDQVLEKMGRSGEHLLNTDRIAGVESSSLPQPKITTLDKNPEDENDMATHKVQYVNGEEQSEPIEMLGLENPADAEVEVKEEEQDVPGYSEEELKLLSGEIKAEDRDQAPDNAGEPVESFDPSAHTVAEVKEYLDGSSDTEQERVLSQERANKNRKGIVGDGGSDDGSEVATVERAQVDEPSDG